MLNIKTLGTFDITLNGNSILYGFEPRRGLLLIYLHDRGGEVERSTMAELLWPDVESALRLNSLRVLLSRMRSQGMEMVEASRTKLVLAKGLRVEYDAGQIRRVGRQVTTANEVTLRNAADLYQGAFLSACALDRFPVLDEWASAVHAEVEVMMGRILERLVPMMLASGSAPEANVRYARLLAELIPEDDAIQALYLKALRANGQLAQALQQFSLYRRSMPEGREVSPELLKLMGQLSQPSYEVRQTPQATDPLASERQGQTSGVKSTEDNKSTENNLDFPYIEHPMIGRKREIAWLISMLNSGRRLISIVGMGGTGKTFFVRSQIEILKERFGNEIYFIDLRDAALYQEHAADALLLSITTALKITPQTGRSLIDQITDALYGRKGCLILDNFETLQSTVLYIVDILKAAQQWTILVTSREHLNLSIESVLPLGGLSQEMQTLPEEKEAQHSQPQAETNTWAEASDAVYYFIQCAQRHDISYTLDAEKRTWIELICQQLDALPLAIELVATQLPFYTLPELAEQTRTDHTLLEGSVGDLPGDHYSVWAVLDSMWNTLDSDERRVLTELTVFASSFHREAMMAVSPAQRQTYNRLMQASLLRNETPAWFSLHPLVKQYAAQRLTDMAAHKRHAQHFLGMFEGGVRMREGLVMQQLTIPPLSARYHADATLAWKWAVAHKDWELLDRSLLRLSRYLDMTFQAEELVQHMQQLLDALPPFQERNQLQHRLAGRAAYNLANYIVQADLPIEFWWERSISWLEAADDPWDVAAAVLAYVDTLFYHSRSWDRIESLLTQARHLIDQYPQQLDLLRIMSDFTACTYFLYQGQWANLRDVQKALVTRMAHPAHSTTFADHLLYATCLDDWRQVKWLIERLDLDNQDSPALSTWQQWAAHHLCSATANAGDITGAIAQRLAILGSYVGHAESFLPLAYAELALWQYLGGDADAAEASAAKVLAYTRQHIDRLHFAFGQLFVAAIYALKGDTARAVPLLHTVLDFGRQLHHPIMIFSALYYLALIHADTLPADLVERILKIGAVSPAMHFVLRPLAREYLAAQGLVIADEEREVLWATDMKAVEALVEEVETRIGEIDD